MITLKVDNLDLTLFEEKGGVGPEVCRRAGLGLWK
jgi:hypothetical protein